MVAGRLARKQLLTLQFLCYVLAWWENGAPDTIRTCGLHLRRVALYPAELRVHLICLADRPLDVNGLASPILFCEPPGAYLSTVRYYSPETAHLENCRAFAFSAIGSSCYVARNFGSAAHSTLGSIAFYAYLVRQPAQQNSSQEGRQHSPRDEKPLKPAADRHGTEARE